MQVNHARVFINIIIYFMVLSATAILFNWFFIFYFGETDIMGIEIVGIFLGGLITCIHHYFIYPYKKPKYLNHIHREKAFKVIQDCAVTVEAQEQMLDNLITMADQLSGLSFWVKDVRDRYAFADKTMRQCLFNNKSLKDIIGKTDSELKESPQCNTHELESLFKLIKPVNYPRISAKMFKGQLVCNVTDVITRTLKTPCRFYECVGDQVYDVWKSPVIENGEVVGTTGALVNITSKKDYWDKGLALAEKEGEAFRIDSTEHFYIKRYGFSTDIPDKGLEVYLRKAFFNLKESV